MTSKKGQMTIFIIIAIVIAMGIALFFVIKNVIIDDLNVPAELEPVFSYYSECISDETRAAINLAGTQGGYVEVPEYKPGSEFAPFSSELNFLGFPVPYWYYISGNGLIKEQMPSKRDIEGQIEDYLEERVEECNFDSFRAQGFEIDLEKPAVRVTIDDELVSVYAEGNLVVKKEDISASRDTHEIEIKTKFGKFYNIAKTIYLRQRDDALLEDYAVDVLRLYAPVDGVETSCSGKIWKTREVVDELKEALEANIGAIKIKGDYYKFNDKTDKYFELDVGSDFDENINLLYYRDMPSKIEIVGENVDNELMMAFPVGIQEGLGIMGFCYAPYHFVYDVTFPVLIQVYDNAEMFQFPIVVIVDNNVAREAIFSEIEGEAADFDLCEFMTQDIVINLYDTNLIPIDADISYECFNQRCNLGKSKDGRLVAKAPSCYNGFLLLRGEGFGEKKELFSTNKESFADIILDREYEVELNMSVGGSPLRGMAIISFSNDEKSKSTALPDVNKIKLSEGAYEVVVYVYGNSSITIPASKKRQCQEIPRTGILGFFGGTKEECFDIDIPETKIEYALKGGGKGETYLLEEQLKKGKISIEVDSLPTPKTLEELQINYAAFETNGIYIT